MSCDYITSMFMSQSDMLYGLGARFYHNPLFKECFMFLLIFFFLYVSLTIYTVNGMYSFNKGCTLLSKRAPLFF